MSNKSYIAKNLVKERPAPKNSTGPIRWLAENLFNSPMNSILSILLAVICSWILWKIISFTILDAVWVASSGKDCRESSGACWAMISERFGFFMYGFYPLEERWRVNLTYIIGLLFLIPLLTPPIPFKKINLLCFFIIYPVVAYLLLHGNFSFGISSEPLLIKIPTSKWGGLMVTIIIGLIGIVFSLPIGILLALGRRSKLPFLSISVTLFIELWRSVPLVTLLFMASFMVPLLFPPDWSSNPDKLWRCTLAVILFSSAYLAEVVRGGLISIPKGQVEASKSLGLSVYHTNLLITLPQALKAVIPAIVGSFISLFKDTSLVLIVGIYDLLNAVLVVTRDTKWISPNATVTAYIFTALVFGIFCFSMSKYASFWERRLNTSQ